MKNKRKCWTNEEVRLLKEFYKTDLHTKEIAKKLNRTKSSICRKANNLGILKSKRATWELTEENRENMRKCKIGIKNSNWKGDNVGYNRLHFWIRENKPKQKLCEKCKKNKPYDLANISQEYKRDINDFEWLCRSCHMKSDGRLEKLHQNKKKKIEERKRRGKDKIYKIGDVTIK